MVEEERKNNKLELLILTLASLFFFFLGKDTGVFWDNVIFVGKMGNHIYENGIFSWNFPNTFDPGHPPFLAFILVIGWNLFGKSLLVSHIVLLPFVFGLLFQIKKLVNHFIESKNIQWIAFLIIICEPTLSSHLTILNPEIFILFFFFLGLNTLLKGKTWIKVFAIAILGITSLRGMLVCSGFFLLELFYHYQKDDLSNKERVKKLIIQYSISAIPSLIFITGRLYFKGWISSHPDFPWLEFRQVVNFKEFIRNLVVLAHRYLDFGKFIIILFIIFVLIKSKFKLDDKLKTLLTVAILPVLPIIITSLREVNPMGHRYFMISFIGLILFSVYYISIQKWKFKNVFWGIFLLSLLTGNLWIYPKDIAQGWDASLAHLPYYGLRRKAIDFLDQNNINISEVTTFSPNATKIDNVNLNDDKREFSPFDNQSKYVLTSTVYNLTDTEIEQLEKNYKSFKTFENCRIKVDILIRTSN